VVPDYQIGTRCIHAGEAPDPSTGAHGVPIYQNATFGFRSYEGVEAWRKGAPHFLYAREGNPTVRSLELKLANLEGAEDAVATATGMAAISATLLHLLKDGGRLLASTDLYAVTRDFLLQDLGHLGVQVTFVDFTNIAQVEHELSNGCTVLFTEVFSNPLLKVVDLAGLARLARSHGATLVVDNTFLSPILLRPLDFGAGIVIHSTTKYLSGHGNVLGGVIAGNRDLIGGIRGFVTRSGASMSAVDAWLLLSGIKTLALRIERHSENAAALANLLHRDASVRAVHYPGLPDHSGADLAAQMTGDRFGGMLAVELRNEQAVRSFINELRLATIAVSLGDTATLVWPLAGTNQIRISTGLEEWPDLEADFARALSAVNRDAMDDDSA